ncbi:MAG: hypothetical protein DPW18_14445 [Chloroflexi bacterium]|nr:hypothetical protein [Chloroflexota bacterium]
MENRTFLTRSLIKAGHFAVLTASLFLNACAPAAPPSTDPPPASPPQITEVATSDFPSAISFSLTATPGGKVYAALGGHEGILVASSTDGGRSFSEPVNASGDAPVHVLPVERPALASFGEDTVAVAWLEQADDFSGASVWLALSTDGGMTFDAPVQAAAEQGGEVVMVQVLLDESGSPMLAWLNDGTLRFTRSIDSGAAFSEAQTVGAGACECCQPSLAMKDGTLFIAYRGLEKQADGNDIRDILLSVSSDGGGTFAPFTRISDEHWFLNACPIAGPSMALFEDEIYVSWMDGRQAEPNRAYNGSIWFSSSKDGGKTFSPNMQINPNPDAHQTLPSLAVDSDGRIHLAWEHHGADEQTIQYSISEDKGAAFSTPRKLIGGFPRMPLLLALPTGEILLGWQDQTGVHVRTWTE